VTQFTVLPIWEGSALAVALQAF